MHTKETILIVEDEAPLREQVSRILQFEGFDVMSAANGREGLQNARRRVPDLIVSDITMPDVDGYAFFKEIRKNRETSMTPFIFLSAMSDHRDVRAAMNLGADDYLLKPFNADELLAAIQTRLERQRKFYELADSRLEGFRKSLNTTIPHEFRTPLTSILGFSEFILAEFGTLERDQIREMVTHISSAGKQLHRLVENYLIFVWLQDSELHGSSAELDKSAFCRADQCFREIERTCREYGRLDDLKLDFEDAMLAISEGHAQKIVLELLDNSCRFSTKGTPIHIIGRVVKGKYHIVVEDEGRGMTPVEISNIGAYVQFNRNFYEQQGLGLGLAIARSLAVVYGGTLDVVSEAADCGTKVTVELQLKPAKRSAG